VTVRSIHNLSVVSASDSPVMIDPCCFCAVVAKSALRSLACRLPPAASICLTFPCHPAAVNATYNFPVPRTCFCTTIGGNIIVINIFDSHFATTLFVNLLDVLSTNSVEEFVITKIFLKKPEVPQSLWARVWRQVWRFFGHLLLRTWFSLSGRSSGLEPHSYSTPKQGSNGQSALRTQCLQHFLTPNIYCPINFSMHYSSDQKVIGCVSTPNPSGANVSAVAAGLTMSKGTVSTSILFATRQA